MDPRLSEAIIPTSVLSGVVEIGQRSGHATDHWFSGTGVTADLLVDPDVRLSFRQVAIILERALRDLPPGPVGMQVGGRDALVSFGVLGLAIRSCATGAEVVAVAMELQQASGILMDAEVERFDGALALRLRERAPRPKLLPFLCEETFSSTVLMLRSVFGSDLDPDRLELSYPEPAYAASYRRLFRCPVRFAAGADRMWFPDTLLDAAVSTRDPSTRAVAVAACRRMLHAGDQRNDVVHAVELLLGRELRAPLTMAQVAERLYVTERTLRRQLRAAGERFSDIRDRVRERRATFLLHESRLPVGAVAREVGFGDPREFRRAYLRWTGSTPRDARTARLPSAALG